MVVARVRRTIAERRLLAPGHHVVVACSGGPDSVALADALARLQRELGVTLVVASVDHGLRSDAARDVEAVGELAERLELPFRPLRVEIERGGSVQAAARSARYEALHRLAASEGARRIAVGHTRDDQAETVAARMLRGAGLDGLRGIAPRRADGVVRPLVDCRRGDLRAHLAWAGLEAREDPTNADPHFERVRLRHRVLPALQQEEPHTVDHLAALADEARAAARARRRRALRLLARAQADDGALAVEPVAQAPEELRRAALRMWAARRTGTQPDRRHVDALERALQGRGEVLFKGGWGVRRAGTHLVATARRAPHTRSTLASVRAGGTSWHSE